MRIRWRGLELPTRVYCDAETKTSTYAKFTVEPFERGLGTTVGNSLRRILLSCLEGSAIVSVKVQGVQHEFTSIPGVVEDVTDIVLNIKGVVVRNHSDIPKQLRIDRHTAGVVTAAEIRAPESVEVINTDHIIATLSEDVPFVVEMDVCNGRGYVPADEARDEDQEVGVINLDAIYSPVLRVRFDTEDTRVGQRTNYDRLNLEVWTDGTIGPEMALVEASKILRKHLNPFVQYFELGPMLPVEQPPAPPPVSPIDSDLQAKLNMSIAELDLSVRASNCLEAENITTVGDLVRRSEPEMLKVRNFGKTSLMEIHEKLSELGLSLGMQLPQQAGTGPAS